MIPNHQFVSSLSLAVHDKVFHLFSLGEENSEFNPHQKLSIADKELTRFKKCLEMCVIAESSCMEAIEKVSKCQDHDKVVDTALGCFRKLFHSRSTRKRRFT